MVRVRSFLFDMRLVLSFFFLISDGASCRVVSRLALSRYVCLVSSCLVLSCLVLVLVLSCLVLT